MKWRRQIKKNLWVFVTGAAVVLTLLGNPGNMGFCIARFLRDTAGGTGMHSAAVVQYVRPEITGILLGAFIIALIKREIPADGRLCTFTRLVWAYASWWAR